MKKMAIALLSLMLMTCLNSQPASALMIDFTATDLPNVTPGKDLWQYSYFLRNQAFSESMGFTVHFDYVSSANLEGPLPTSSSQWSILTWQPDVDLPDGGAYDALALVGTPSLSGPFSVSFEWLGTGAPGSQLFELYQYDPVYDLVTVLDWGFTQPGTAAPVPEPGTVFLLSVGLAGILWLGQRRKIYLRKGKKSPCSTTYVNSKAIGGANV